MTGQLVSSARGQLLTSVHCSRDRIWDLLLWLWLALPGHRLLAGNPALPAWVLGPYGVVMELVP